MPNLWVEVFGFLLISGASYVMSSSETIYMEGRGRKWVSGESMVMEIVRDWTHAFKVLCFYFFKLHCPWSWKTAVKYRVQNAHDLLVVPGTTHEKGWTSEQCHESRYHDQIARDCFQSRLGYWSTEMLKLVTIIPRYIFLVISAIIISLTWFCIELIGKFRKLSY